MYVVRKRGSDTVMEIIVVMDFCDGFGNDGYVIGLYDSIRTARGLLPQNENYRYIKTTLNKTHGFFDYYEAIPLFSMCKKGKRKK